MADARSARGNRLFGQRGQGLQKTEGGPNLRKQTHVKPIAHGRWSATLVPRWGCRMASMRLSTFEDSKDTAWIRGIHAVETGRECLRRWESVRPMRELWWKPFVRQICLGWRVAMYYSAEPQDPRLAGREGRRETGQACCGDPQFSAVTAF